MRAKLLAWLPADLHGLRLLDAGCGTGALALAAAERGAEVVAVDLSPQLVALARERSAASPAASRIAFHSGDMLDPAFGRFDYVVMMDSIIHYGTEDALAALANVAARTRPRHLLHLCAAHQAAQPDARRRQDVFRAATAPRRSSRRKRRCFAPP